MGGGGLQLLQAGGSSLLAGRTLQKRSTPCRTRSTIALAFTQIQTHQQLQLQLHDRHSTLIALVPIRKRRSSGIVSCSDSNSSIIDSVAEAEPAQDVDSDSSSSSPAVPPLVGGGGSFTVAGIEVVRSIEEAENEVLKAVSEGAITPVELESSSFSGPMQVSAASEQQSSPSAVAASVMVSEVANAMKSLEKGVRESGRDGDEDDEEESVVDDHAKMMTALEQLTSAVEPAIMATEVADVLLSKTNEDGGIEGQRESAVGAEGKNFFEQFREIVAFAGPALGIWLSGPIMSLIDTAVIGNSSSLELAALGPGTVLCDQSCYVFMFLSVATSNLIATALAQKDKNEAAAHLSRLLFVSLACGLAMFFTITFGATRILTAFVGTKNANLVPAALPYVQIRAMAWPAVLVGMVAQSASLGMQDSRGPLKVLAIASLVNLFGDILLCTLLGYGIAGAAWATMASQYVACFLLLTSLNAKGYNVLAISVPSWKEFSRMVNLAGPVLLTMLFKVLFYTVVTYLATSLGPVTLAGHQVMMGVYSLCTVWGEPLAQTAQSFMPALICGTERNLKKARELLRSLMLIGATVGLTLGCLAISVPWFFPQVFTRDPAIVAQMRLVSVPFLVGLMITPPTLALEGTLLAGRDMKFLGFSMVTCFFGGSLLLLTANRLGLGLPGSWWTIAAFQWVRFSQAYSRLHSSRSILADPILPHEEDSLLKTA